MWDEELNQEQAEALLKHQMGNFTCIYTPLLLAFGPVDGHYLNTLITFHEQVKTWNIIQDDGSFYFTYKKIQDRIGYNQSHQVKILKRLREIGVVSTKLRGIPPRNYFTIHFDAIYQLIKKFINNPQIVLEDYLNSPRGLIKRKENLVEVKLTNSKEDKNPSGFQSSSFEFTGTENVPGLLTENNIKLIRRTKPIPTLTQEDKSIQHRYRKDVIDIIKYWNSSPGLIHHKMPNESDTPTKTFSRLVDIIKKVIDGKFTPIYDQAYSKEDIIIVIDRFKLAATNPSYYPTNKNALKSIGLDDFFYSPFSLNITSYFLKYLKEEPKLISNTAFKKEEEKNPQLCQWLKEFYFKKVLCTDIPKLSPVDENKFVRGSNLLKDRIEKLQKSLNMMTRPVEWCGYVIDSLIDRWGVENINIGNISSEYTYYDVLVRYLRKKGRIN